MRRALRRCVYVGVAAALGVAALARAQDPPGLPVTPEASRELPARSVDPTATPAQDRAIEKRLRQIYAQVEGLEQIEVAVEAGVVRLGGEVLSARARDRADQIARQLEGVIEVENGVAEVRDVARRLQPALDTLQERLVGLISFLPLVVLALATFALFLLLAHLVTRWERPFRSVARNRFARDLLRQALRTAIVLGGAVVALEIVDATALVAAVAGAAGLAGLALGFAFRDLAENYIASVLLSLRQPFLPNDHVVIEGHEGNVVRLTSRATILMNLDGNHVRIPNAMVFKAVILNYTRNPRRRFHFVLGVASDTDLGRARDLGLDVLRRMDGMIAEPPPRAWIDALGDWNVALHFVGWIDQRETDWLKARSEAIRSVKERFDAEGIQMPEPTLRVAAIEASRADAATPPVPPRAVDVGAERHLEREVAAERAAGGEDTDLLDASSDAVE